MNLAYKQHYLINIPAMFSTNIWEYDIKQANINILRAMGKIDEEEYNRLSIMPKIDREVTVGKLIDDKIIDYKIINNGINLSKLKFLTVNNANPSNIMRIANDSIYYISPLPLKYNVISLEDENPIIKLNNHPITFVCKNHFTSYVKLNKVLVFFSNDNDEWNIDIKGIGKQNHYLHQDLLSFICTIIQSKELGDIQTTMRIYNEFYNSYVSYNLPISYYREFNADSCFAIKGNGGFKSISISNQTNILNLDISYNLNILRQLYALLLMD